MVLYPAISGGSSHRWHAERYSRIGTPTPQVGLVHEGEAYRPSRLPRILVSLSTYNERDNLAPLVPEIHRVLPAAKACSVIDDNSPDGTGKLADEMAIADPRIHVLHRSGKLGLGTAILAGIAHAAAG